MAYCGGRSSAIERRGRDDDKSPASMAVRYGRLNIIGEFSYPPHLQLTCGAKLVIQTDRGIEIGQQVLLTCTGCDYAASPEQVKSYVQASGEDVYRFRNGRILREATAADLAELRHIEEGTEAKLDTCCRFAAELGLEMKIVDCEHIFGGERIVFYFMSDERVDFRELVRRLAAEFQTRIEMRQVGARDEARLLADYETCGRECCCRNFLKILKPVGMQMAKMQKATLDPSKVSGRCGRLKCCLRYEHETYEKLVKKLPRVNSRVSTREGTGRVVDRQILTQLLKIVDDDGRAFVVTVDDILERNLPEPPREPENTDDMSGPRESRNRPGRESSTGEGPDASPRSDGMTEDLPPLDGDDESGFSG